MSDKVAGAEIDRQDNVGQDRFEQLLLRVESEEISRHPVRDFMYCKTESVHEQVKSEGKKDPKS
jgi:hypothetical protein